MLACRLFLYDEPRSSSLKIEEIASYIKSLWPNLEVCCRGDFIHYHLSHLPDLHKEKAFQELAVKWAGLRVVSLTEKEGNKEVFPVEADYEKRRMKSLNSRASGILYKGPQVVAMLMDLLPSGEKVPENIHVIFTNQLLGTWSEEDSRYHARVSIYGPVHVISTLGVVVAPAKPREYYFLRRSFASLGMEASQEMAGEFMQECLVTEDPRLTGVLKGYVCQALFYYFTGNPFCHNPYCRLYNAHWQKELFTCQLSGPPEFCADHQRAILSLGQ
jgi:hypothetical protein